MYQWFRVLKNAVLGIGFVLILNNGFGITPEQLNAMPPNQVSTIKATMNEVFGSMTPAQAKALPPAQKKANMQKLAQLLDQKLAPKNRLQFLTPTQIKAIPPNLKRMFDEGVMVFRPQDINQVVQTPQKIYLKIPNPQGTNSLMYIFLVKSKKDLLVLFTQNTLFDITPTEFNPAGDIVLQVKVSYLNLFPSERGFY